MLIKHVRDGTEDVLMEEQCGFRRGRGCVDQVFEVVVVVEVPQALCPSSPELLRKAAACTGFNTLSSWSVCYVCIWNGHIPTYSNMSGGLGDVHT